MDEFENFKNSVMLDNSIDKDMKEILIQSKKEQVEKQNKKSIENALRANLVALLIVKLKTYNKIELNQKKYLIEQIENWIYGKIISIKLETDTLYELNELIDQIKLSQQNIDDIKIKKIFEPKYLDDYLCFIDLMDQIKMSSIKEEHEKIEKKETMKKNEIANRQKLLEIVIHNLNKLSCFDLEIKKVKIDIEPSLNEFLNLKTTHIELEQDVGEKLIKFIKSIRIDNENKELLLQTILIK